MNTNNSADEPRRDQPSDGRSTKNTRTVGDQNVQRLLAEAYQPEGVDPAFAERVRGAALKRSSDLAASRPAKRQAARAIGRRALWIATGAVTAAAVLGLAWFGRRSESQPNRPFRDGDIVWIDGRPYVPVDDAAGTSAGAAALTPLVNAAGRQPTLTLASRGGMRPRPRDAAPAALQVEAGEAVSTAAGQRKRLALSDAVLLVNENTQIEVLGPRTVRVRRGEVFVVVSAPAKSQAVLPEAPQPPSEAASDATSVDRGARAFRVLVPPFTRGGYQPQQRLETSGPARFSVVAAPATTHVAVAVGEVRATGVNQPLATGQQAVLPAEGGADLPPLRRTARIPEWTRELVAAAETPLVPASKHAGGALEAIDPQGQRAELELRKYHIDVHIENGFARTTIDQTYFNHLYGRLEGTFYFPLPPDASISRLAMYVNGKLMEGGMAERDHARNVFETIKHRALDPALLEWIDGSTFKMRVFPLEGRQEKRIILSYTQKLSTDQGRAAYRFPAGHNLEQTGQWSASLRIVEGAASNWSCRSHELKAQTVKQDLVLTSVSRQADLDRDMVLLFDDPFSRKEPQFTATEFEGHRYLMLRMRPRLPGDSKKGRRDWVFLLDADGSRSPLLARVQIDIVRTLLENASPDDTFSIITAGTRQHALAEKPLPATPENLQRANEFMESMHLLGALDLQQALKTANSFVSACSEPIFVHLGGAVPILGSRDTKALLLELDSRAPYIGVAVGKRWNRNWMRAAADHTGGYVSQINPDEPTELRTLELLTSLNTPRLLGLTVASGADRPRTFHVLDRQIESGGELCAIGRWELDAEEQVRSVNVKGTLDGQPFERQITVEDVTEGGAYLPRMWAKLAIESMLADDRAKHRAEIVELSKAMYVMSPFTSLLVLENDEMYEQHSIDRGRDDHWAIYPAPKEIKVVKELPAGPAPRPPSESAAKVKSRPEPAAVLQTVLLPQPDGTAYSWFVALGGRVTSVPDGGVVVLGGLRRGLDPRQQPWGLISADRFGEPRVWDVDINGNSLGWSRREMHWGHHFMVDFDFDIDDDLDGVRDWRRPGADHIWIDLQYGTAPQLDLIPSYSVFFRQPPVGRLYTNGRSVVNFTRDSSTADFDDLIRLITSTVNPSSWEDVAGSEFSNELSLIIQQRQTLVEPPLTEFSAPRRQHTNSYYVVPDFFPPSTGATSVPVSTRGSNPRLVALLKRQLTADFEKRELAAALEELSKRMDAPIVIHGSSLRQSKISVETPVTLKLDEPVQFRSALKLILEPLKLGFFVSGEAIEVAAASDLSVIHSARMQAGHRWLMLYRKPDVAPTARHTPLSLTARRREALAEAVWRGLVNPRPRPVLSYPQHAGLGDRNALRRLVRFAPGITSTWADILAVIEAESNFERPAVGKVDPQAGKLIDRARETGWRRVSWKDSGPSEQQLWIDGRGRFRLERRLPSGLRERVLADGATVRHHYVELGLGAVRQGSRFHRAEILRMAPWLTPAAEDLAVGHDLRLIGPRTVAVVPIEKDKQGDRVGQREGPSDPKQPARSAADVETRLRLHLVFGENGELRERQLVEMPSGKRVARVVIHPGGAIRWLNREGKLVHEMQPRLEPSAAPGWEVDERRLVMLPLPIRSRQYVNQQVEKLAQTNRSSSPPNTALEQIAQEKRTGKQTLLTLPEPLALQQLLADHWQNPTTMQDTIGRRFFAHGDRRIGFYTLLLSSGLQWNLQQAQPLSDGTTTIMNPLQDHPQSALAAYLAQELHLPPAGPRTTRTAKSGDAASASDASAVVEEGTTATPQRVPRDGNEFVESLAEYRDLFDAWSPAANSSLDAERRRGEMDRLFRFIERTQSPTFAYVLLRRVQERLGAQQPHGRIAAALLELERKGPASYTVKYELARSLRQTGRSAEAQQLLLQLYREALDAGMLPAIDQLFFETLQKYQGQLPVATAEGDPQGAAGLLCGACRLLVARGQRLPALTLVEQCRQLGQKDLADQLFAICLRGLEPEEEFVTTLAGIDCLLGAGQTQRAVKLLTPLLESAAGANTAALWRLSAEVAQRNDRLGASIRGMEQWLELRYAKLSGSYSVDKWGQDYQTLFKKYAELAGLLADLSDVEPRESLARRVIRSADRWRQLSTKLDPPCEAASDVLARLGLDDLAWDYLTTPLAAKPNESTAWLKLAATLAKREQAGMAVRAYQEAFAAEPTNPQILWDQAVLLEKQGRRRDAQQLYRQIAAGRWQPRFQSLQRQAERSVVRKPGERPTD